MYQVVISGNLDYQMTLIQRKEHVKKIHEPKETYRLNEKLSRRSVRYSKRDTSLVVYYVVKSEKELLGREGLDIRKTNRTIKVSG